jgi:hypothetical protein
VGTSNSCPKKSITEKCLVWKSPDFKFEMSCLLHLFFVPTVATTLRIITQLIIYAVNAMCCTPPQHTCRVTIQYISKISVISTWMLYSSIYACRGHFLIHQEIPTRCHVTVLYFLLCQSLRVSDTFCVHHQEINKTDCICNIWYGNSIVRPAVILAESGLSQDELIHDAQNTEHKKKSLFNPEFQSPNRE